MSDPRLPRPAVELPADLRTVDERLRAWHAERLSGVLAPAPLVGGVAGIPARVPSRGRLLDSRRAVALLAAAMLLALTVGTVILGSGLLRLPWQVRVLPPSESPASSPLPAERAMFGAAAPCEVFVPGFFPWGDSVLRLSLDDRSVTLGPDGRLVAVTPATASLDATYTRQRLTPRAVSRIQASAAEAGLAPGCRTANVPALGNATLMLQQGGAISYLVLGPQATYVATPEEQAALQALFDDLEHPAQWLAAADLVDADPAPYIPERWVLTSDELSDTAPGQGGTNAADVELPGGGTLGDFGELVSADAIGGPSVPRRCMDLSLVDARAVRNSLVSAGAYSESGSDGLWEIGAPGNVDYQVSIHALLPGAPDCAALITRAAAPRPTASPLPLGDLSAVDACNMLPADWDPHHANDLVNFDVASSTCAGEQPGADFWGDEATVTMRGASTSVDEARRWAMALFGDGVQEERLGERTVWFNACATRALRCPPVAAISEGRYFVVVQYLPTNTELDPLDQLRGFLEESLKSAAPERS